MSADQGDSDDTFSYGICLLNGFGITKDDGSAAHYFKMSGNVFQEMKQRTGLNQLVLICRNTVRVASGYETLAERTKLGIS
jgi:hypothetical protein